MIKNRMPLTKLLTIVLLIITFFTVCMGYLASLDMRTSDEAKAFAMVFGTISVFLFITSLGIWRKQNWARIFLMIILGIMILAWTILLWYWYQAVKLEMNRVQRFLPPLFSVFVYCILLGGIFFLNNSKVKEEFREKLSQ